MTAEPRRLTGANVRTWRERVGLTQQGLADLLDVVADTVGGWERSGKVPRWADTLIRRKAELLNLEPPEATP